MTTRLLAAAAALALAAAGLAHADEAARLTLNVQGLTAQKGVVMAALYDEANYAKGQKAAGLLQADVTGERVSGEIADLKPGRYAVKMFHDVNGDGKMNTNPFGIPTEPVAFSNDAPMRFGPAKWADAVFEVKPGANVHTITLK